MGVLQDTVLAEQVDHVTEILCPVVYKALQTTPRKSLEPFTGQVASSRHKYTMPAELDSNQQLLLATAAGGFGPKLFPRCIPEHAALVDGLERVIAKLVPAAHWGTEKPGAVTETEMRGIMAAFDRMPLNVDEHHNVRCAAGYNYMDKGRSFLLWGYVTSRLVCSDLTPGIFSVIGALQQTSNKGKEVKDALQFFGMDSAQAFNTMQGHLQQAASGAAVKLAQIVEARPADHGGPAPAYHSGAAAWQIYWPCVFLHCCEVRQTLNALGKDRVEQAIQRRRASGEILQQFLQGHSGHDPFMLVLVSHAITAKTRLRDKQTCPLYCNKPAKKSKRTAPRHQTPAKKTKSKQVEKSDRQADLQIAQGDRTPSRCDGQVGASSAASTRPRAGSKKVPCQCSGMCAKGSPICPARLRWYKNGIVGGCSCPNPAAIMKQAAKRHYCKSCLCRAAGCCNPRRRSLFCSEHAKTNKTPRNAYLGWARIISAGDSRE